MNKNPYEYNAVEVDGFKISPSGFANSLSAPDEWYKNNILKISTFNGKEATVFGTLIHARIEHYFETKEDVVPEGEVEFIEKNIALGNFTDFETVQLELDKVWNVIKNEYCDAIENPILNEVEIKYRVPLTDNWIAGTIDAIEAGGVGNEVIITDYKTTKKTPSDMSVSHYLQAMLYALAVRETTRYIPTKIKIVYIVRLKRVPKIVIFERDISEIDYKFIKRQVEILLYKLKRIEDDPAAAEVFFNINPLAYNINVDNMLVDVEAEIQKDKVKNQLKELI